jgi:putative peptidoglycan lipid II flippase
VLISAAIAVYGLFLALSGAIRWDDAVTAVRQTKPADLRD